MSLKRLALVAPLVLLAGACAPRPETQAELCAIQALPARPGVDTFATAATEGLPALDLKAQTDGVAYSPSPWPAAWWGRCPKKADTTQMILLGPEPWALTKGGPRHNGRQVAFGTCFHRKEGGIWRTVACRINP